MRVTLPKVATSPRFKPSEATGGAADARWRPVRRRFSSSVGRPAGTAALIRGVGRMWFGLLVFEDVEDLDLVGPERCSPRLVAWPGLPRGSAGGSLHAMRARTPSMCGSPAVYLERMRRDIKLRTAGWARMSS